MLAQKEKPTQIKLAHQPGSIHNRKNLNKYTVILKNNFTEKMIF